MTLIVHSVIIFCSDVEGAGLGNTNCMADSLILSKNVFSGEGI